MATEETILETVRRERAKALKREAAQSNGARMGLGYSEGRCTSFRVIEEGRPVTRGILCGSRAPRRKCQVCKKKWSIAQCDYPVGGDCKKCKGKGQTHIGALEVTEETVKDGIRAYLCHDCAGTARAMCNKRVCALRWCDFDAANAELNIRHTLYKGELKKTKTKASAGIISIAPAVAEMLMDARAESLFQDDSDFIFCGPDGRPYTDWSLRRSLQTAMAKVGIEGGRADYGFQVFRHSAGSLVWRKTRDLKLVQSMLGHARSETTADVYLHLERETRNESAAIMADEILTNCDLIVTRKGRKTG